MYWSLRIWPLHCPLSLNPPGRLCACRLPRADDAQGAGHAVGARRAPAVRLGPRQGLAAPVHLHRCPVAVSPAFVRRKSHTTQLPSFGNTPASPLQCSPATPYPRSTAYTAASADAGAGSSDDLRLVEVGVRCSLEQMLEEGFYHAGPARRCWGSTAAALPAVLESALQSENACGTRQSRPPFPPPPPPPALATRPTPRQPAAHARWTPGLPRLWHVWQRERQWGRRPRNGWMLPLEMDKGVPLRLCKEAPSDVHGWTI